MTFMEEHSREKTQVVRPSIIADACHLVHLINGVHTVSQRLHPDFLDGAGWSARLLLK